MQLINSKECAEYARQKWVKIKDLEAVYAMYLNDKFEVQLFTQINTSNYRETNFNAREAAKAALFFNFDHIILFHNHTSQIALPSEMDISLTLDAIDHYAFFNIDLADHIIVTVNDHYSFSDHGMLKKIAVCLIIAASSIGFALGNSANMLCA